MKSIRSVFIMLIGMISLTVFSATTELDQKSKVEQIGFVFQQDQDQTISQVDFRTSTEIYSQPSLKQNVTATIVINDWSPNQKITSPTLYKEKLQVDFNKDFAAKIKEQNVPRSLEQNS